MAGYYLQLSRQLITLNRYDYGEETLQAARIGDISDGASHTLSVRAESNRFVVVLDDKYRIEDSDDCAFMSGQLGIFSTSGRIEIPDAPLSGIMFINYYSNTVKERKEKL